MDFIFYFCDWIIRLKVLTLGFRFPIINILDY